jgi:hypothetical protein
MSNMTPFEIRLELLKMAKDMLEQEYHGKREKLHNEWNVQVENARHAGGATPVFPDLPAFPTETEVIKKATELNGFVSQIPTQENTKTSKKST